MLLLSILYGFAVSAICVLLLGKLVEGNLNRSSKGRKTSPSSPPNTSEGVRGRTRQGSFSASPPPPPPAQSVHTMLGEPERPQRARGTTRSSTPAGPPRTQSDDPKEDQASAPSSSSAPVVRLTRPPPPSILIGDEGAPQQQLQKKKLSFVSSTDALQGRRDGMEDSHISIDELARYFPDTFLAFQQRGLPNAFYGIYDGHVGKRASTFVSDVLHDRICRHPSFVVDSLVPSAEGSDDDAVADKPTISEEAKSGILKALEEGFLQTDKEFIEDAVKAENKWKDGTTAVVAMLLDSHLFLANLGDSEALLGQREYDQSAGVWRESFEVVSELHKPTMPAERARIEKEGGFIVGGRVGGLSVSRSFGDRNMKLPIEEDGFWHGVLVDPHPYVAHRQLTSKDCFLLLGCDGVWENWTHQESVDFVFEKLDQGLTVDELTEATTKRAMEKGSMDNISATIILFKWE